MPTAIIHRSYSEGKLFREIWGKVKKRPTPACWSSFPEDGHFITGSRRFGRQCRFCRTGRIRAASDLDLITHADIVRFESEREYDKNDLNDKTSRVAAVVGLAGFGGSMVVRQGDSLQTCLVRHEAYHEHCTCPN